MSELNTDDGSEHTPSHGESSQGLARKETRLLKYTETIDKLVVQNKQLQKDLNDADDEISTLNERLTESNIRISKTLFYIGLIVLGYFVYSGNQHLTAVDKQLVEMNVVLKEYKDEIAKTKQYNEMLEKNLGISKDKKGGK